MTRISVGCERLCFVMTGLDPVIHTITTTPQRRMDARIKSGQDGWNGCVRRRKSALAVSGVFTTKAPRHQDIKEPRLEGIEDFWCLGGES
ncbi:hypothetical protein [Azospirillum soli]|uniref:hypothetical protein n=1 Tax=Azospirillum soli TaxID=1304799 RepID=UPI001AEB7D5C|nr:hypothetical protein [Azospirillum soli]MBP2313472.1 hypothetical protein [Azospirillum soli]